MARDIFDAKGRVFTGHEGELDLERTAIDGGTREEVGGDPDSGVSQGRTYVHDTRGTVRYVSGDKSGLGLGYNSVDFTKAAYHMASASYIEHKERWRCMDPEAKQQEYALRRQKRANRTAAEVRVDSINRKSKPIYKRFVADREEGWQWGDPDEIKRTNRIDSASAFEIASRWRLEEDQRRFVAMVVRYAAWLEDIDPKLIRQRFRRKGGDEHQHMAEFVYLNDAQAAGVLRADLFDAERLRARQGRMAGLDLITPRANSERRNWLITEAEKFYASGALYPPYVAVIAGAEPTNVPELIEEAGLDPAAYSENEALV